MGTLGEQKRKLRILKLLKSWWKPSEGNWSLWGQSSRKPEVPSAKQKTGMKRQMQNNSERQVNQQKNFHLFTIDQPCLFLCFLHHETTTRSFSLYSHCLNRLVVWSTVKLTCNERMATEWEIYTANRAIKNETIVNATDQKVIQQALCN